MMARSEEHVDNIAAQLLALHRRTHAGTVIAPSAQIENVLEKLLLVHMRSLTKKEHTRLFRGYGPLSSFAAKTDMAYASKIIPKPMFDALDILRRLRNEADRRQTQNLPKSALFHHPRGTTGTVGEQLSRGLP